MEVSSHIEALRTEGDRMAEAVGAAAAEAAVPTCPGWVVRDLARHIGGVHRWATGIVSTPRPEPGGADLDAVVGRWPEDGELEPWFRQGLAGLVAALEAAPPDLECWTFLPAPSPLAMWARRQAHETAVHRVDAERAAGRTTDELSPLAPALAADGADELLTCFVPRRRTGLHADPPTSLRVRCTDEDAGWVLLIDGDGVTTSPAVDGDAACTVRGRAADLYLALWNRRSPEVLAVEGDPGVLGLFLDSVHVRWA
jgi:uncharacterized protein (TIGR03083 family)